MDMHVRSIVVNETLEGKACGWCQNGLKLGEYAVICTACEQTHHGRCWEGRAGCPTASCAHAPLRRLDVDVSGAVAKANAPGAVSSLVFGVLGFLGFKVAPLFGATPVGLLLFFGAPLIFGIIAVREARAARKAMASDPTLSRNWATGGLVVGVIDLTLWTLMITTILLALLLMPSRR
jgi:hypothetical protein